MAQTQLWPCPTSSPSGRPSQDPNSQAGRPGPRAWVTPGSCTARWCYPAQLPVGSASRGECY
uniref:Uncharacterized protein n=1 Tax=Propithecus coquereli TaxID=379532 RepID=A0A2K6FES8_PROCO